MNKSAFFCEDTAQIAGLNTNYTGTGSSEKWPYTRGIVDYCHASPVASGNVGSTGWSTGPHCHFEVRRNGVPVNPL